MPMTSNYLLFHPGATLKMWRKLSQPFWSYKWKQTDTELYIYKIEIILDYWEYVSMTAMWCVILCVRASTHLAAVFFHRCWWHWLPASHADVCSVWRNWVMVHHRVGLYRNSGQAKILTRLLDSARFEKNAMWKSVSCTSLLVNAAAKFLRPSYLADINTIVVWFFVGED